MPELQISKKSIGKLFSEMQGKKFIIPDFQRPYKWDREKCETLWNDIEDFTVSEVKEKENSDYFLGTIVSHLNEHGNQEIIDGQQRITSFFLMLRAFYTKLENMSQDNRDVIGLMNQLKPCIWDTNEISQEISDTSNIHIESLVATEEDNSVFHEILKTGKYNDRKNDNYSINYDYFKKCCDKYAEDNPLQWQKLCVTILNKCIILPIVCDKSETALTIFSTLNDRGLPLEDSDIFKAQIYRNKQPDEREEFSNDWKELYQICKQAYIRLDDVFRYYSHVLRARNNDRSKEVGLRKFYSKEKFKLLKEDSLLSDITALAKFWNCINTRVEPDEDEGYSISFEARKFLHCLTRYPNDFWKYATSVFFLKNKGDQSFDENFCLFLKKIIAFLFAKFIEFPTVNAIKDDVYSACISIHDQNKLQTKFEIDKESLSKKITEYSSSKISRALLLLDAYLNPNQETLIPQNFDIEHIFPKKWQDTNYNGWTIDKAQQYLDRFGNKIAIEKKLNIQAGNRYFRAKKQKYEGSTIASLRDLSKYEKNDWAKEDIEAREEIFKTNIINFFKKHLRQY